MEVMRLAAVFAILGAVASGVSLQEDGTYVAYEFSRDINIMSFAMHVDSSRSTCRLVLLLHITVATAVRAQDARATHSRNYLINLLFLRKPNREIGAHVKRLYVFTTTSWNTLHNAP